MVQLLIARHGNTFDKGDVIRRVGRGTDLCLSQSGRVQAKQLGEYLQQAHPQIACVYTSTLKRTIETAQVAMESMRCGAQVDMIATDIFDEIDYGPDEGMPETQVVARLGEAALQQWDQHNVVPDGWSVDPQAIAENWQQFGAHIQQQFANQTVLVVTSNGTARFAPQHQVKLSTGGISLLTILHDNWTPVYTNRKA